MGITKHSQVAFRGPLVLMRTTTHYSYLHLQHMQQQILNTFDFAWITNESISLLSHLNKLCFFVTTCDKVE
jgi:hypothetical protein